MAKIDEITALLIDEIQSFEKAISKLQVESEKIKSTKFTIDTTSFNLKFSKLLTSIEESFKNQESQTRKLQNQLNKTVMIPKWITVLFSSFFVLFLLSFSLNFYQHQKTKEIEKVAFENGKNEAIRHFSVFFNKNKNSKKQYDKWIKTSKK